MPNETQSPAHLRTYRAFISYSHTDTKWATWLLKRLEGYRVPERFHGRAAPVGLVGARIAPIFRDRDELPTADDLGEAVQAALQQSATLIVICSPAAARSRWVNEEAMSFKRLGRTDRIFAFVVEGEPNAREPAEECFPPALRFALEPDGRLSRQPVELIAADAREHADGREDAFIRLVAGLLGVGFDDLRQREMHRRHRRMMWITAGSTAGMAITLGLTVLAWRAREAAIIARNDAQRRQENSELVMAQMLEDLESRLKKADQLEALDDVARKVMAYFKSLDPRDLTDRSNTQQAKLFTQIGQIYLSRLRYADATESFKETLNRTAALVARHPRNADMLYERAQAEYWIGFVPYQEGKYAEVAEWWRRYRDSGMALAALDPTNPKWRREAVLGEHNLAALDLKRGDLAAARQGFLNTREGHERLAALLPNDPEVQVSLANVDSYLGSIAERSGDFAEAVARFGAQVARLENLVKADALSPRMRQRLATALGLQSDAMAAAGQRAAAVGRRQLSLEIFEALIAHDQANREWQASTLSARLKLATLLVAQGEKGTADRLVRECLPAVEALARSASSTRGLAVSLAMAWRLEAQRRAAAGEPAVGEAVAKALAAGQALLELDRGDEANRSVCAVARVVAGEIALRAGDAAMARQHLEAALQAVGPGLGESRHWRLLEPAARALTLLGRHEEARPLLEVLRRIDFQPLEPWPAPDQTFVRQP